MGHFEELCPRNHSSRNGIDFFCSPKIDPPYYAIILYWLLCALTTSTTATTTAAAVATSDNAKWNPEMISMLFELHRIGKRKRRREITVLKLSVWQAKGEHIYSDSVLLLLLFLNLGAFSIWLVDTPDTFSLFSFWKETECVWAISVVISSRK